MLTAGAITLGASPASADVPSAGQLCTALESIQFYSSVNGSPSYVAQAGEFIRVAQVYDYQWALGHSPDHSDRFFVYRHADGGQRLGACHFT